MGRIYDTYFVSELLLLRLVKKYNSYTIQLYTVHNFHKYTFQH